MRRRDLIGGAAAALLGAPLGALAQARALPFVGVLSTGSPNERAEMMEWFRLGLKQGGYADGKDVAIEYRWAEGRYERLPKLAAELVERKVAVIATSGGGPSSLAAKRATSDIPIVFVTAADPVKLGLVGTLGHPGGNVTGVASVTGSLDVKRLQIFRELLPKANFAAYLVDRKEPGTEAAIQRMQAAGAALGTRIDVIDATSEAEIDAAFARAKQLHVQAVHVATAALFTTRRNQLVALAARYAIPTSYHRREFAVAGGLISYGPSYRDVYRQAGVYTARILGGAKPADLPVVQADKFELVLNLKTARKLGIAVARDLLARVDEVIE
jgi:putative ABC transport system substrate-binding protein